MKKRARNRVVVTEHIDFWIIAIDMSTKCGEERNATDYPNHGIRSEHVHQSPATDHQSEDLPASECDDTWMLTRLPIWLNCDATSLVYIVSIETLSL